MRTPSAAYSTVGREAKEQRGAEQAILESPALQAALRRVLAMSQPLLATSSTYEDSDGGEH